MTLLLCFGRWSSPLSVCRNHSVVAAESSGSVSFKLWPLLVLQRITATCKSEYEIYIYHLFKSVSGSKIGDKCSNLKFPRNKLGCLHWLCTCSVWYPYIKDAHYEISNLFCIFSVVKMLVFWREKWPYLPQSGVLLYQLMLASLASSV